MLPVSSSLPLQSWLRTTCGNCCEWQRHGDISLLQLCAAAMLLRPPVAPCGHMLVCLEDDDRAESGGEERRNSMESDQAASAADADIASALHATLEEGLLLHRNQLQRRQLRADTSVEQLCTWLSDVDQRRVEGTLNTPPPSPGRQLWRARSGAALQGQVEEDALMMSQNQLRFSSEVSAGNEGRPESDSEDDLLRIPSAPAGGRRLSALPPQPPPPPPAAPDELQFSPVAAHSPAQLSPGGHHFDASSGDDVRMETVPAPAAMLLPSSDTPRPGRSVEGAPLEPRRDWQLVRPHRLRAVLLLVDLHRGRPGAHDCLVDALEHRRLQGRGLQRDIEHLTVVATCPARRLAQLPRRLRERFLVCAFAPRRAARLPPSPPLDPAARSALSRDPQQAVRELLGHAGRGRSIYPPTGVVLSSAVLSYMHQCVQRCRQHPDVREVPCQLYMRHADCSVRAIAKARGRDFVTPEDVRALIPHLLAHRLRVAPQLDITDPEGVTAMAALVPHGAKPQDRSPNALAATRYWSSRSNEDMLWCVTAAIEAAAAARHGGGGGAGPPSPRGGSGLLRQRSHRQNSFVASSSDESSYWHTPGVNGWPLPQPAVELDPHGRQLRATLAFIHRVIDRTPVPL
eukprot:TRINITY_DN3464_c0_g2_i1.p1 TRINITY_DN3464_c0_g2~~TRINITY_DN3464_c0_g2_i1.p1  ORF type:complete len:628 (+),score=136.35 TRINITY_DN3464_c0_g2_i1:114-1997(+)